MIDYDALQAFAAPFRRADARPAEVLDAHDVGEDALILFAVEYARGSSLFKSPAPTDLDGAAVFIAGFQLGLLVGERLPDAPCRLCGELCEGEFGHAYEPMTARERVRDLEEDD